MSDTSVLETKAPTQNDSQYELINNSLRNTLNIERAALKSLQSYLTNPDNPVFYQACQMLLQCQGRVIIIGMGKSGHIGRKIAATFASTGTPAFFVHPGEANHGDIGMLTPSDVVIAISYSGETLEVINLLPNIKRMQIPVIAITGKPESTLAKMSKLVLKAEISKEACPLNLAPTSSTTVTLVLGDALAIALLEARGFTPENFAFFHPGGSLGKRLLLEVKDLMYSDQDIPKVTPNLRIDHALIEMTEKSLGMTTVIDENGSLLGIYTDGDLRRTVDRGHDVRTTLIAEVMTKNCRTIKPEMLASDALQLMKQNKITSLVVINNLNQPIGVLHMHALLRAGVA